MATLLAVEDDEIIQKHLVRLANHNGWKIEVASTASTGFEKFVKANGQFDLILMDIATPGDLDGIECAKRIRAGEQTSPRIPIIALTAHAYPEDRARCLEAGMDDYLSKPFTMNQFADMVKKWLPAASMADAQGND